MTLILISSLLLTPAHAVITTYIWDNIHYVEGTNIDYPHPDRTYYDISRSSDWIMTGTKLIHYQINHDTSAQILWGGLPLACSVIGLTIGAMCSGSPYGAAIGGLVGAVLGAIAAVEGFVMEDEEDCIWFWISISFFNWLVNNAWWLGPLYLASPVAAYSFVLQSFLACGYFRLGPSTLCDAVGAGNPSPLTLTISASSGGTTNPAPGNYTYEYGSSVLVLANAYSHYAFYYWLVDGNMIYDNPITVTMNCHHDLYACFVYSDDVGGGCPYVYIWNGQQYVKDNNLLPASEKSNGSDVEDYYKLESPLVPTHEGTLFSSYSLQISEFEHEHDFIDQVKLTVIDHASDVNIAVTPEGEILAYRQPLAPISCTDNNGTSRLDEVVSMNGNVSDTTTYFDGYPGDYLVLDFGDIDAENAKLILRDDRKCMEVCIEVQIPSESGGWQTVEVLHPRDYWAVEAVNLATYVPEEGSFIVRLLWTAPHRLDYVGLDTTPQDDFTLHHAVLTSATHSTEGNVLPKLLLKDDNYAELLPNQQLQLTFWLPNNQDEERTFILYAEGHYTAIAT